MSSPPVPVPVPVPVPEGDPPGSGTGAQRGHRALAPLFLILLLGSTAWTQPVELPPLRLLLAGPTATRFATTDAPDADDAGLVELLASARPSLSWSACLARAADAFSATTVARRAESLPPDLLEAVLLRAGCPDPYAEVGTVVGGPADAVTLADELARAAVRPYTHGGLGHAEEPAGGTRWAVVLSRRLAEVEPFPVRLAADRASELRFHLARGLDQPRVAVVLPTGRVQRPEVRCGAEVCAAEIAVGDQPGALWIQLVARDDAGDLLAAQVRSGVDVEPPTHWEGLTLAEPEPAVTATEGEARLAILVNDERRRHGLAPLLVDPTLAAAARTHSADMRDARFFDHRSPTRGGLMARLENAGYPVRSARENIARSSGVATAHAALMASPGHRANLLWPEMTHLGVGAVPAAGDDRAGPLIITEILALPTASSSAETAREQVLSRLAVARDRAGLPPLRRDDRLDRWAEGVARQSARSGALDPGALGTLDADLGPPGEGSRSVRAELLSASEPALLRIPEALVQVGNGDLGIGLELGAPGSRGLPVTVVLVVVETPPVPVGPPAE